MFRSFIRQILIENSQKDYAVMVFDSPTNSNVNSIGDQFWGIIYDAARLEKSWKKNESSFNEFEKIVFESLVGIIKLRERPEPCNGALEVILTAGPGEGKLIYSLGGYIAKMLGKTGIFPDRSSISDSAYAGWIKQRSREEGKPLDNINNPQNSDPNDDCKVWDDSRSNVIDRSYKGPTFDFEPMKKRGINISNAILNDEKLQFKNMNELKSFIVQCAKQFFGSHYR